MKILLINENPVVKKLVTLSAQKTSDDVEVIMGIDDLTPQKCDLLIVDDHIIEDENALDLITKDIKSKSSLFMASRGVDKPGFFENTITKPFLPTDLVELFSHLSKKLEAMPDADEELESDTIESLESDSDALETLDVADELSFDDEISDAADTLENLDDLSFDDEISDADDTLEDLDDAIGNESEDLSLEEGTEGIDDLENFQDDELNLEVNDLDELDISDDAGEKTTTVLDEDDVAEVQGLLDSEDDKAEEEPSDNISEDDISIEDDFDSEDDFDMDSLEEELPEEALDDTLEDDTSIEDDFDTLDSDESDEGDTQDLLDSIDDLDEDVLNQEVDISDFDDLDENLLKEALGGEEVDENQQELPQEVEDVEESAFDNDLGDVSEGDSMTPAQGAEALSALVKLLEDDNLSDKFKELNISINISVKA